MPQNLPERIADIIRAWPQWSRRERSRMESDLIPEILDHCRNGTGNAFIASWCDRILSPALRGKR